MADGWRLMANGWRLMADGWRLMANGWRLMAGGYLARLTPRGLVVMHLSNRHMELASVVATLAQAQGLTAYVKQDDRANDFVNDYRANANVAVLARNLADLGDLPTRRGWRKLEPTPGVSEWTDDYSDVLHAILRKKLGR